MKRKKPELSDEEKAQREEVKSYNRKFAGYKRSIKTMCGDGNLRSMELKLEFLKAHPGTKLPNATFNHSQTVNCWEDAIKEYKEGKS